MSAPPLAAAATRAGRLALARRALAEGLGSAGPFRALLALLERIPHLAGPIGPAAAPAPRPVVVMGNPRTGSTLLQRLLVDLRVGAGPRLYQQLLPGGRRWPLVRPLLPLLRPLDPGRFHDPAIHETSLLHAETDEIALLAAEADGLFAFSFFWSFADDDWTALVDPAQRDTTARDLALLGAQHAAVSAAAGGAPVVSRAFGLGPALPALLDAWPDARVLFVLRDPASFLPSARSLVLTTLAARLGPRFTPALQARVGGRIERGLVQLAARSADALHALRPAQRARVRLVGYPRLTGALGAEAGAILDFLGHSPSPAARSLLARRAEAQAVRRSAHHYPAASPLAGDPALEGYRALLAEASAGV